jgi:lipopolysaccharide transport system permease protein
MRCGASIRGQSFGERCVATNITQNLRKLLDVSYRDSDYSKMSNLLPPLLDSLTQVMWRKRSLLLGTVWTELRSLYAGSVLGVAWSFGGPLVLMALYAVMYGVVLRVQPATMSFASYVLYVAVGLIPFISFSSSVAVGATSLARDKQVLLNTFFPSELIGIRAVLVQYAPMVGGLFVAILLAALMGRVTILVLLVPVVVLLQIMFSVSLVWILSLLTLALRDIQHVIQYIMFSLLLVTPIGYDRSLVPRSLEWLMYFNPLYYFVVCYQDLIVFGKLPSLLVVLIVVSGSVIFFTLAHMIFMRAKSIFYDYV